VFQDHQVAYLREHVKVKEERRLSFLRESVGYVLSRSARRIPHAAAVIHYDVSRLVEYAAESKKAIEENGDARSGRSRLQRAVRRTFSAFFIKAIAHGLYHLPEANAFLDYAPWRTRGTLYIAEDINLSFTVHTKHGVIKPIVRNPHHKDLETVACEMRELARRARRTDPEELYRKASNAYMRTAIRQLDVGALPALWVWLRSKLRRPNLDPSLVDVPADQKLQVTDILGATCTVANIGSVMSGHQTVTVIIPPEVMMFGIGDISQVPRVVDGEVKPRYVVTIAATLDHRAFDGGEAFPLHEHIQRYVDDPRLIYEWKPGDPV
jgi:pyruvate/2-oxoglutarate dehydrogenase complex dihydrolipoamide acyltransferase (E2) component